MTRNFPLVAHYIKICYLSSWCKSGVQHPQRVGFHVNYSSIRHPDGSRRCYNDNPKICECEYPQMGGWRKDQLESLLSIIFIYEPREVKQSVKIIKYSEFKPI